MKTSELQGAALDWAVAKCEPDDKLSIYFDEITGEPLCYDDWPDNQEFRPSTDWAQGGPIIEREKLDAFWNADAEWWSVAGYDERADREVVMRDKSYLVAAMRCYVASKLGEYVDVPEELV